MYIDNEYDAKIIDKINNSQIVECMIVEMSQHNSTEKLIIGNMYRPPRNHDFRNNLNTFFNEIEPIIEKYSKSKHDFVLAGDTNINLLKIN